MGIRKYLIGEKFGRLTIIGYSQKKNYRKCKCECGKETEVYISNLQTGHTTSCGCFFTENMKELFTTHGDSKKCRIYRVWSNMKDRCYNQNNTHYKDYGQRGIFVCDEWLDNYPAFKEWSIQNGYSDNLEIDRINNNQGYFPDNCQWTTQKININNTRKNISITVWNETKTLAQWCEDERVNVPYQRVWQRITLLNWTPEEAFVVPKLKNQYDDLRTKLNTIGIVGV